MKRIRIGNDIRVQTSLHDLNDFDITSIKQLRCYFIPQGDSHTTPTTDTYDPMQYTICNCGKPKYNVFPCNIDAPHWFCGYNGFGVNSKRFIHVDTKFLAPSRLLEEQNRIEAYFPAKAQHQIGEYKFVIVLTIYQPGWCENNLRTITLDQGIIFALTNDDKDPDHDTTINLDIAYAESIDVPDLLYIYKTLDLGETDQKLTNYNVNIRYSDESLRKFTKDEFNEYIRTTVVNNIGNIRVKNNGQIVNDDIYSQVDANITYSLRKSYNEDPITKTIRVLSDGRMYRINYNCPSRYKINSNFENQIYITDDGQNQKLPLFHFTISKQPGVNPSLLPSITNVTATNCTLKYDESNKMYNVYAPVTGDININVNVSEDYMDTRLIDYTTVTDLRIEGDNEINPMHSEMQLDKQFGSFTVFDKRPTKNLDDIIITADGCIVKEISRNSESIKYGINGPITANYGEINISCTLKETPKPVDKEHTYTIQYTYDNTQYTVNGPSEVKILNSELSTDKLIGSLNITCIGENTSVDNIQVTATGCNVKSIATQETIHTYKLCGPITATSNIINVNITTKQNLRVTSIVVPDSIMLQHTSHLNIGDLGYDGTAYNIRIYYNDGSYKSVNADEFGELITVVTGATGNITVAETGMIARLNMFENVDEQVTYQLKENSSIKDTMRIVSSGKMYTINYNYDSNYVTVNGNTFAYVDDTTKIGDALPVTTFTVIPTNNEYIMTSLDMEITGASLINKPDPNTSVTRAEVTIVTPVTSDEIAITITASQFRP